MDADQQNLVTYSSRIRGWPDTGTCERADRYPRDKGVKPAPEDGQDGGSWEGVDADSDGDFEMS